MSINRWMDKQSVVCADNRILLRLKKECSSDLCYHTDELQDATLSEKNAPTTVEVRWEVEWWLSDVGAGG